MSVVLHGVEKFLAAADAKVAAMRVASRDATAKALHLIERRAKQKLGQKSHRPGTPTPANPGEPPALVTGNLRRSITVTGPEAIGPSMWKGQVGPTAVYGRIQELGGIARGRTLPARPYMRPSFEELKDEIVDLFKTAWTEAVLK